MRTKTVTSCTRTRSCGDPAERSDDRRRGELADLIRQPWRLRVDLETLRIRPSTANDLASLALMHRRCSARSLLDRYRAGGRPPAVIAMDRQLRAPLTFVAETMHGAIVAIGALTPDPQHADGAVEIAVLVEDSWQRLGIATELMSHLAGAAQVAGYSELIAYPGTEVAAAQRLMIGVGRTRMVPDDDMHLHTYLPDNAMLGLGAVRARLVG